MRLRRDDAEWQRLTPPLSGRHPGRRSPCEPPARAMLVVLPLAGGSGRCEARDAALTERRRRCVRAAPNLPYPGAVVRLRPSVCAAGRSYPRAPRNRPREVQRYDGEAHDAKRSSPSNAKLALVAYWDGLAVCAESNRQNPAYSDGTRASGCSHATLAQSGLHQIRQQRRRRRRESLYSRQNDICLGVNAEVLAMQ